MALTKAPALLIHLLTFAIFVNGQSTLNSTTSTFNGTLMNTTTEGNQTATATGVTTSSSSTAKSTQPIILETDPYVPSTSTQPPDPTLLPPLLLPINRDKVVFTVIRVPTDQNVDVRSWWSDMEDKLARLCSNAFLRLLISSRSSRRGKRLASSGDVQVQLLHVARANPTIKEKVTLSYLVSQLGEVLPGIQVELAMAFVGTQDVVLELGYPVDISAQALEDTESNHSTDPPDLTEREIGLIIGLSVIGGLVVVGVLIWFVCCCVASQMRNRAEFRRVDIEKGGQPQLISAASLDKVEPKELGTEPEKRALPEPERRDVPEPMRDMKPKSLLKSKPSSSDDGFSEEEVRTRRSNASTPPYSRSSSHSRGRPSRQRNRIAPTFGTVDADGPVYASISKLPPLDPRKYLVSNEADMAELEYFRNKHHNRSLRDSARYHSLSKRKRPAKPFQDTDSDTGLETEELVEHMDQNRTRMHKLLDDVLAIASPSPSKKHKPEGSITSSKKSKDKKQKKGKMSGSSSSSSSSSSDSDSSKRSKKSDKSCDKDEESSKKKKMNSKKDKSAKKEKEKVKDVPHEPLSLGSTGDPYSQFSLSPYAASDAAATLKLGDSIKSQTSAKSADPPLAMTSSDSMMSTGHDWSKRRTINIPKPKLGMPELNQLANIKSAANDDNYTSLVLSTAMFTSQSPNWEEPT